MNRSHVLGVGMPHGHDHASKCSLSWSSRTDRAYLHASKWLSFAAQGLAVTILPHLGAHVLRQLQEASPADRMMAFLLPCVKAWSARASLQAGTGTWGTAGIQAARVWPVSCTVSQLCDISVWQLQD